MINSVKGNALWTVAMLLPIFLSSGAVSAQSTPGTHTGQKGGTLHEKSHDMNVIHQMFNYTSKIKRSVKTTARGVETITESSDPKVAAMIQEHVLAMRTRMKNHQPIRAWDELFAALFRNADKVQFEITKTKHGVKIAEVSDDPYTLKIIHAHANAVSDFIEDGMMGMAKAHPAPRKAQEAVKIVPAAFLGRGDGITTCPVTGEPIDRTVKAEIGGHTIYFCCASCVAVATKRPALYLKAIRGKR